MPMVYRKGPKWQKDNRVKVKLVKRNITTEKVKEIIVKEESTESVITNDQSLAKTIGWELGCSFVLGCVISNLLYTLVNSEGYSLYRITFSESTWYALLFAIITFVSMHVFISLLFSLNFITKQDIKYSDFCAQFTTTFKYVALLALVVFFASLLLPISTSIKIGLLVAVVIILMVSIYDAYSKMFARNGQYLMTIFAVSVVLGMLIYILLSGFVQGNFTRL